MNAISLAVHSGKMPLMAIHHGHSGFCEHLKIVLEELSVSGLTALLAT